MSIVVLGSKFSRGKGWGGERPELVVGHVYSLLYCFIIPEVISIKRFLENIFLLIGVINIVITRDSYLIIWP